MGWLVKVVVIFYLVVLSIFFVFFIWKEAYLASQVGDSDVEMLIILKNVVIQNLNCDMIEV